MEYPQLHNVIYIYTYYMYIYIYIIHTIKYNIIHGLWTTYVSCDAPSVGIKHPTEHHRPDPTDRVEGHVVRTCTITGWLKLYCLANTQLFRIFVFFYIWLVVTGTMEFWMTFPSYWEFHHPNWRTHIFSEGRSTTNQIILGNIKGWSVLSKGLYGFRDCRDLFWMHTKWGSLWYAMTLWNHYGKWDALLSLCHLLFGVCAFRSQSSVGYGSTWKLLGICSHFFHIFPWSNLKLAV